MVKFGPLAVSAADRIFLSAGVLTSDGNRDDDE